MKTRRNHTQAQNLPKRNDRWRWMLQATAASAAAATSSNAAIVQINLINNQLSVHANTLDADVTGTAGQFLISGTHIATSPSQETFSGIMGSLLIESVKINMVNLGASHYGGGDNLAVGPQPPRSTVAVGASVKKDDSSPLFGLIPVTFTDSKFNGGALTNACLEVSAQGFASINPTTHSPEIKLIRLIFDDANPDSALTGVVAGGTNTEIGSTQSGFFAGIKNDFNLDGGPDLLWQNVSNGRLAVWLMNGTAVLSEVSLGTEFDKDWQIAGSGVFNSSGYNDLLWHNSSTGQVAVWFMNGTTVLSRQIILTQADKAWKIAGTGDFNGDGKPDILWQNSSNGQVWVFLMSGTTVLSKQYIATQPNTAWKIVGTGDFNGDGNTDLLWQDTSTGTVAVWFMNGTTHASSAIIGTEGNTSWKIAGTGDFNGDGKPDILWQNASTGGIAVWLMNGTTVLSEKIIATEANTSWQIRNK